jgi:hypothetical protein
MLVVSDIHGKRAEVQKVVRACGEWDCVAIAGDLTDFGDRRGAAAVLAPFVKSGKPMVAVSGNCDLEGVREFLAESGYSVDGRGRVVAGLRFAGSGGGLHRNGMTPYELSEDELEEGLLGAIGSCPEDPGPWVYLTHTPPQGTDSDRRGSTHSGSLSFRTLLSEHRPTLWISGHIHESRAVSLVGRTTLVNPGSLAEGSYAVIDFGPGAGSPPLAASLMWL